MVWIVLLVIVVALIFLPQFWVRRVLKKHSNVRSDFPGTGGEFARHLIKQQGLKVKLETTEQGDHYDPSSRTVRLSSENFNGKSLTAVATAAHEVGHAIQHQQGMALLLLRSPLAKFAFYVEKIAQVALISTPVFLSFLPGVGRLSLIVAIAGMQDFTGLCFDVCLCRIGQLIKHLALAQVPTSLTPQFIAGQLTTHSAVNIAKQPQPRQRHRS